MERVSTINEPAKTSPRTEVQRTHGERSFLLALLACTWIPMLFFLLFAPPDSATGSLAGVKTVFLFLGTAHVPATLFFYTDKNFRGVIQQHRLRYIVVPILLIVATGILFAVLNATGVALLLLTYWAWQAFHYGRQNIGVYAFASIAEGGTAPLRSEKLAIDFGTILGILGTFKILGATTAPTFLHQHFDLLYKIGAAAFIAVAVFSLVIYIKFFRRMTLLKTLFFFTSVFFFLPVFLSTQMNIAFLSYAIAHGVQYLVFMGIVSAKTTDRRTVTFHFLQWHPNALCFNFGCRIRFLARRRFGYVWSDQVQPDSRCSGKLPLWRGAGRNDVPLCRGCERLETKPGPATRLHHEALRFHLQQEELRTRPQHPQSHKKKRGRRLPAS